MESAILDLARIFSGLSSDRDMLEKLVDSLAGGKNIGENNDACFTLLTSCLLANGLASLSYIETTPLDLVSGIHKVPFCG